MTTQIIEPGKSIVERDGLSPQDVQRAAQQRTVLEGFAKGMSYESAARYAGVHRKTIYNWKAGDEEFAAELEHAIQAGVDLLEDEAHRRAMGWTETVFNKDGDVVGERFTASDRLMEFMLSGRRPEKFRAKAGATNVNIDNRSQTINALAPEAMEILQRLANASGGNYDRGKGEDK